ncbi:hypothetical protein EV363DRAFT_1246400 [Boletus edulis]|nr:hypothetical protein EV363DRAFT_1246400 [Boletus edulis]
MPMCHAQQEWPRLTNLLQHNRPFFHATSLLTSGALQIFGYVSPRRRSHRNTFLGPQGRFCNRDRVICINRSRANF